MVNRKNIKRRDIFQLALSILIIILLNFIASFIFKRFDLTSEKRYTLAPSTRDMLKSLDDVVYVKVYLEGKFPGAAGFTRLRNETKEILDEFRAYSNDNVDYQFIDPNEIADKKQREDFYRTLFKQGIIPVPLEVKTEQGTTSQIIFPGALVSFHGREVPLQLLKTQMGASPDAQLNNSVQSLEYELSNSIRKLNTPLKSRIAFIDGHQELDTLSLADITQTLQEYYEVEHVTLKENIAALTERDTTKTGETTLWNKYKLILVAKPDSAFTEKDKFIIDQFIMNGGKVLWLVDPVLVNEDSLRTGFSLGLASESNHNLQDMLYKYGIRMNANLIQDMQCSFIPINKAFVNTPARYELEPWLFYPLIQPSGNHPIIKNLDLIKFNYVSSIDTIASRGIKKTILLKTSRYTKLVNSPVRIALAMAMINPDERQFIKAYEPVAVLLEGVFESSFKNQLTKDFAGRKEIAFQEKSKPTKMIMISDGDVIKNTIQRSTQKVFPLGYDVWTKRTFGNKTFILNCVNYLLDDAGLMAVRSREIQLRLLDKKKISNKEGKLSWQVFNTVIPVAVVILYGMLQFYIRKRKYAR